MRENNFFFEEPIYRSLRDYTRQLEKFGESATNKVEESHYFWLWYALTQNSDYSCRCESPEKAKQDDDLLNKGSSLEVLHRVYEDFGDVRYKGDKHEAFMKWWCEPVILRNTDPIPNRPIKKVMPRGEYLFSEPLLDGWILQVENLEQAEQSLNLDSHALISIPLTTSKKHTEKRIRELLERFHPAYIDQERKDPRNSKALYPPSRNLQIKKLQGMFKVYDFKEKLDNEGSALSNAEIADELGIQVQLEGTEGQDTSQEMEQYIRNGERISRLYSDARELVEAAGNGQFP